jgi:hypothetical protein
MTKISVYISASDPYINFTREHLVDIELPYEELIRNRDALHHLFEKLRKDFRVLNVIVEKPIEGMICTLSVISSTDVITDADGTKTHKIGLIWINGSHFLTDSAPDFVRRYFMPEVFLADGSSGGLKSFEKDEFERILSGAGEVIPVRMFAAHGELSVDMRKFVIEESRSYHEIVQDESFYQEIFHLMCNSEPKLGDIVQKSKAGSLQVILPHYMIMGPDKKIMREIALVWENSEHVHALEGAPQYVKNFYGLVSADLSKGVGAAAEPGAARAGAGGAAAEPRHSISPVVFESGGGAGGPGVEARAGAGGACC